jgi:hypothetical protein
MKAFTIKHKVFHMQKELQWIFQICSVHESNLKIF